MTEISVSSSTIINVQPEDVWPLLCNFKLPNRPKWYFRSIPFPRQCEVIGKKGLGAHRKCKTTTCQIDQKITEWSPPKRLAFVSLSATGNLLKNTKKFEYILTLEQVPQGTKMTCVTNLDIILNPFVAMVKKSIICFILIKLQKFTIRGIKILAEDKFLKN